MGQHNAGRVVGQGGLDHFTRTPYGTQIYIHQSPNELVVETRSVTVAADATTSFTLIAITAGRRAITKTSAPMIFSHR